MFCFDLSHSPLPVWSHMQDTSNLFQRETIHVSFGADCHGGVVRDTWPEVGGGGGGEGMLHRGSLVGARGGGSRGVGTAHSDPTPSHGAARTGLAQDVLCLSFCDSFIELQLCARPYAGLCGVLLCPKLPSLGGD